MAEEKARSRLYDYSLNSNLVIDNRRRGRREEPSGAAQSLPVDSKLMGDRAGRAQAPRRKQKAQEDDEQDGSLTGLYRPKTRETREALEELLSVIQKYLGGQPRDVLHAAADEVLAIIKNPETVASQKRIDCNKLLESSMGEAEFSGLVRICDRVTDFSLAALSALEESDRQDIGVAVVFDEDSESDDNVSHVDEQELSEEERSSEEEDLGDDTGEDRQRRSQGFDGLDAKGNVDVKAIDAYWIQRQLSRYYEDANEAQQRAKSVLACLGQTDERACENQLVLLLEFDKFDLIRLLLQNRKRIWYCTRLKQAQTDKDRQEIHAEMEKDQSPGGGRDILDLLESQDVGEEGQPGAVGKQKQQRKIQVLDHDESLGKGEGYLVESRESYEPPVRLDLASLVFSAGDHTMTNKKVKLPQGAWRKQNAGFEEVHIPPLKPRPFGEDEKLVAIEDLPPFARPGFSKMKSLNRVQSRIFPTALHEDCNLLVCAPTGAGKTNVAMLTVLHEIGKYVSDARTGAIDVDRMKAEMKIVYIAPMKALVQEVVINFTQRLTSAYGVVVRELSGDQQLSRTEIAETQIIVTTPEKWDIVTRKAGERAYTQLVKLVIVDEIHLLHNERGAVLESIIARMIRQQEVTQQRVRLVGISATLPNYKDVAAFCRVPLATGLFFFDNSFRPVPLQQQYVGITETKPLKRLRRSNEICFDKVKAALRNNRQDQVLVFVHSRKDTAATGRAVRELAEAAGELEIFLNESKPETKEVLQSESEEKARSADLKELLPFGLGIHHAGMVRSDRNLVEELFKGGYIKVLFCTATLAWGVNLPAHTVIIKGTQVYNPEKGQWTEVSQLDILQMLGRAGRPQYDTEGEGIIITTHAEVQFYLSLLNEQLPIESQLMRRLTDTLNAELVSGSVQTLHDAARWIGYTYLYVRMQRNPSHYGISQDEKEHDRTLFQRRINMAHSAALLLDKAQLIRYDRRTGYMQVTPLGRIASHYYVTYDTMQRFNDFLKPTMTDIDLFRVFSLSREFADLIVREEEKVELAQLADRAPIPIKESLDEPSAKVNVLLQSYISGLRLEGYALACDLIFIQQNASRLFRALFEICLAREWALMALRCLTMANMCDHRLWPSQLFLRQLKNTGLGLDLLRKLERHNLTVDQYFALSPQELGELSGGGIKLGRSLHRIVHCFPRVELSAQVQPITRSTLRVDLTIAPDFEFDESFYGTSALPFWVIVEDGDGEVILHHELLVISQKNAHIEHETHFTVPLSSPLPTHYFCKVVCDRFMHSEAVLPVSFRKLVLPDRYVPPTELLDMRPIPTKVALDEVAGSPEMGHLDLAFLRHAFDVLFTSRFAAFNTIQTQAFHALFYSEENTFLAAPSGSGKTVCAELTILRTLAADASARCVYVAPIEAVCQQRFVEWTQTFSNQLGKSVAILTGETTTDLRLVGNSSIVISVPEHWDNLSRRWKQRKAVREVSLFIVDELHLVGSLQRSVLEIVVSRMRLVANMTKKSRLVAFSASVANGSDLAAWVGAPKSNGFNFHPSNRPNRLEIHLRGFDVNHFGTRLLSMARPTFDAIMQHSKGGAKQSIVFVPSKRQTKVSAIDLITFAAARHVVGSKLASARQELKGWTGKSLFRNEEQVAELESALPKIEDPTLRTTLEFGVGYLHEGTTLADRAVVEALYETGIIRVLVVASSLCWGFRLSSHLVVIMEASRFEGALSGYVDYPISDVWQMVGRAGTAGDVAHCVVLCHAKRKNFLKKFLHDPLPVESHLNFDLADHLCAEVVSGIIKTKQDAVDYLTWTLFYRRLGKNPNYYNLSGSDTELLSDFLSELVENALNELEESKCISIEENEMDVGPLNLGMIASYYYIQYTTIKLFALNLRAQSKLKRVLDVLVSAEEFEEVAVRHKEDVQLASLANHLPIPLTEPDFLESRTKAHILLQLHFCRRKLTPDQKEDLDKILLHALRLLQAMVDITSSNGWLRPSLAAMELSQMIVQARWSTDSPLLQVPFFDAAIVERCNAVGVKRVFDMEELDEDKLKSVLQLPDAKLKEAVKFYDSYPNIEASVSVSNGTSCVAGEPVELEILLERLDDDDDDEEEGGEGKNSNNKEYGRVYAPFYPAPKIEGYWIIAGDPASNKLFTIKRVTLLKQAKVKLELDAPEKPGDFELKLYVMCDSVMGADQVHPVKLQVVEGDPNDGSDSDSGSDSGSSSTSS